MRLTFKGFPRSKLERWVKPILILGISLAIVGGIVIIGALLSLTGVEALPTAGILCWWGIGIGIVGLLFIFFSDVIHWMCSFETHFADMSFEMVTIANNLDTIAKELSTLNNKEEKK